MVTRQDFERIAEVIDESRRIVKSNRTLAYDSDLAVKAVAAKISQVFHEANPRFDKDKFMQACGYTTDTKEVKNATT
jgi:hypothetical protein